MFTDLPFKDCFEHSEVQKQNESPHEKTKVLISFAVTAKVFRYYESLFYLNTKFQASNHLLLLYRSVCVGPGRNPNCWFSHAQAQILMYGVNPVEDKLSDQQGNMSVK